MANQLTLLGTGSCELDPARAATSALFQIADLNVAFDFGRGAALAIPRMGIKQDQLRHIVISHFHPDHSSDLIPYLQAACWSRIDSRSQELNIYGPKGIAALIQRLIAVYDENNLHRPDRFALNVFEVTEPFIEIEGQRFEFVDLPPHDNHGLALSVNGKRYALTADSYFHDQEVQFIKEADVAVIDCGHQSADEIVRLAARAQPKMLVLSHLYKNPQLGKLRADAAEAGFNGEIQIAFDGLTFRFDKS